MQSSVTTVTFLCLIVSVSCMQRRSSSEEDDSGQLYFGRRNLNPNINSLFFGKRAAPSPYGSSLFFGKRSAKSKRTEALRRFRNAVEELLEYEEGRGGEIEKWCPETRLLEFKNIAFKAHVIKLCVFWFHENYTDRNFSTQNFISSKLLRKMNKGR